MSRLKELEFYDQNRAVGEKKQLKEDLEMKLKEERKVLKKRGRHFEASLGKAAIG